MFFVFDIGGTKTRAAISTDGRTIDKFEILPTPQDYSVGIRAISQLAKKLAPKAKFSVVAGGIAGIFNPNRTQLWHSPHLPDWDRKNIAQELESLFQCPVYLENDAALVGLGEAVAGAGKDFSNMAYITVSTGVGGARIVNKRIDHSLYGFEPGHQIINYHPMGNSEQLLTWEQLVSGSGILKRMKTAPDGITDSKFWEEFHYYLAAGLYNTILHWSPQAVVIGGGLMSSGKIDIDILTQNLQQLPQVYPALPLLVKANLQEMGGLLGSLAYIQINSTVKHI